MPQVPKKNSDAAKLEVEYKFLTTRHLKYFRSNVKCASRTKI